MCGCVRACLRLCALNCFIIQDPVASTTDVLVSLLQSTSTCIIVLLEQALKTDNVVRDLKDNVLQLQGDLDMANCKSSKAVEAVSTTIAVYHH